MPPIYPNLPLEVVLAVGRAALSGKRRSFRQDALRCTRDLPLAVRGLEHIPHTGPVVIVMNHYHRPGFQAFWISLAISSVVSMEIHWTMTGAWTDDGTPGAGWRAWLSPHFLPRLAEVYGFTSMPPMPPRSFEVQARAAAVRRILDIARQNPQSLLALAPEGRDSPDGRLIQPPSGAGRLLALLDGLGYPYLPVGVAENERSLTLNFGPSFRLNLPPGISKMDRDEQASVQVMTAIASQLPEALRGPFTQ